MAKALRTHPFDVVVALRLLRPVGTLSQLAAELGVVPSQVHAALRRLDLAGLLKPEQRLANPRALSEFLLAGVRYAFPVHRGALVDGIPTAYSAPPLAGEYASLDVVVWPAPRHPQAVRGFALTPLYPKAPLLVEQSAATYRMLTLVDALRIGDPRVRTLARAEMERAVRTL